MSRHVLAGDCTGWYGLALKGQGEHTIAQSDPLPDAEEDKALKCLRRSFPLFPLPLQWPERPPLGLRRASSKTSPLFFLLLPLRISAAWRCFTKWRHILTCSADLETRLMFWCKTGFRSLSWGVQTLRCCPTPIEKLACVQRTMVKCMMGLKKPCFILKGITSVLRPGFISRNEAFAELEPK